MQNPKTAWETLIVLRCYLDKDLEPGVHYGPVIRSFYVFECCTKGYSTVIINGKEFSFGPGDAYVLFPGDIATHTTDLSDPLEGIYCFTTGRALNKISVSSSQPF